MSTIAVYLLVGLNIAKTFSGSSIGVVNSALLVVQHYVIVLIWRRSITGAIRVCIA